MRIGLILVYTLDVTIGGAQPIGCFKDTLRAYARAHRIFDRCLLGAFINK
jgi:hypothetical protein